MVQSQVCSRRAVGMVTGWRAGLGWTAQLCFRATVNRISIGSYQATRDTNSRRSTGTGLMQTPANGLCCCCDEGGDGGDEKLREEQTGTRLISLEQVQRVGFSRLMEDFQTCTSAELHCLCHSESTARRRRAQTNGRHLAV